MSGSVAGREAPTGPATSTDTRPGTGSGISRRVSEGNRRRRFENQEPPSGAAHVEQTTWLVDDGRGGARPGRQPDQRDDAPSDQGIDRDRDQRLRLEDRSALLRCIEDAVER